MSTAKSEFEGRVTAKTNEYIMNHRLSIAAGHTLYRFGAQDPLILEIVRAAKLLSDVVYAERAKWGNEKTVGYEMLVRYTNLVNKLNNFEQAIKKE